MHSFLAPRRLSSRGILEVELPVLQRRGGWERLMFGFQQSPNALILCQYLPDGSCGFRHRHMAARQLLIVSQKIQNGFRARDTP